MLFRSLFVPLHLWLVNDIPPIHPFNHRIPVSLSVVNNLKYVWLGDICMKAGWTHFQNTQDGIWCISLVFFYLCFSSMEFRKCCDSDLPRSCFIPSCLKPSIFLNAKFRWMIAYAILQITVQVFSLHEKIWTN